MLFSHKAQDSACSFHQVTTYIYKIQQVITLSWLYEAKFQLPHSAAN